MRPSPRAFVEVNWLLPEYSDTALIMSLSILSYALLDTPEALNEHPYEAWLVEVKDITDKEALMDAAAYKALCEAEG